MMTLENNMQRSLFEKEIIEKIGILLFKPDAVKLGIVEYVINHITKYLMENNIGQLEGVYIIDRITNDKIPLLYPDLPEDGHHIVRSYLSEDVCVMVTFKGYSHMLDVMKEIKGKRLIDWSLEEIQNGVGIEQFVRGLIPVPGSIEEYRDVINKLILKKSDSSTRFTDEEFIVYCRNLIHSPDNFKEVQGLLSLLTEDQIGEVLGQRLFEKYFNY